MVVAVVVQIVRLSHHAVVGDGGLHHKLRLNHNLVWLRSGLLSRTVGRCRSSWAEGARATGS